MGLMVVSLFSIFTVQVSFGQEKAAESVVFSSNNTIIAQLTPTSLLCQLLYEGGIVAPEDGGEFGDVQTYCQEHGLNYCGDLAGLHCCGINCSPTPAN